MQRSDRFVIPRDRFVQMTLIVSDKKEAEDRGIKCGGKIFNRFLRAKKVRLVRIRLHRNEKIVERDREKGLKLF